MQAFPGTTIIEVKAVIRQKLSNAVKLLKKKTVV
jgi:hypothetical protein